MEDDDAREESIRELEKLIVLCLWNEKGRVVRSRNSQVISVELEMLRLVCY